MLWGFLQARLLRLVRFKNDLLNKILCYFKRYLLFFFFLNNIYLVTTLLMTILTFTWRKNKNKVQEIKEKYDVTAFATN